MSKRHEFQTFTRLQRVAQAETRAILQALPDEIRPAVQDVGFQFEERPAPSSMNAETLIREQGRTVTVYLMNVFGRYGHEPGAFKAELRRLLVQELADMAGVDVTWGEP